MREAANLWLASLVGVRIFIATAGPSAILTLEPHRENPETLLWLSTVTEVTGGRVRVHTCEPGIFRFSQPKVIAAFFPLKLIF